MSRKIQVGIVGCGNVAKKYSEQLAGYENIGILGFADVDRDRAVTFSAEYGGKAYDSLDAMLADPAVELIVNLTIHHVHVEVITKCLEAGKHVHTEKPLAMDPVEAMQLVEMAERKGLRFSSAPITYMGEAQQAAWKALREGKVGTARLAYAEVNHGRIETWHPNPEPFYAVGVLWDVGLYPVTLLTAFSGPVRRVTASSHLLFPDRLTKEGRPFTISVPDCWFAILEFESGLVARLTANFYTKSQQGGSVEIHGDDGTVYLGNFQRFDAPVSYTPWQGTTAPLPYAAEPYPGIEFARGVRDLADAILHDRPHRANARHAAHVIEILAAIQKSAAQKAPIPVTSEFPPPWPMD